MKVSVCVPTYKRPHLIRIALESILSQSEPAYEILVGDDSPDETTAEVVAAIRNTVPANNIRYWHHRPSLGQARNVQDLFQKATGDLITLMHDDDSYRPGAFVALSKPFREYPDIAAAYGRQVLQEPNHCESWPATWALMRAYGKGEGVRSGIVKNAFEAGALKIFPNNSYFVRADVVRRIDYSDNDRARSACDFYFGIRLGALGLPFYFVENFVANYYLSPISIARSGSDAGFYQTRILLEDYDVAHFTDAMRERLRQTIKLGIHESVGIDRRQGWKWFFSEYHRRAILTPGGLHRFLRLLLA